MTDRSSTAGRAALRRGPLAPLVLGAGVAWAFWPSLKDMLQRWSSEPRYAHGYLVPAFALALLWMRRDRLPAAPPGPAWGGLALIAAGAALHLLGAYLYFDWFDAISLLPVLAGCVALLGGWPLLRWAGPAIAFLAFMIPLPYRVEMALGWPLQRMATEASTFALQTMGISALAEGNVIALEREKLNVVEACSGLSMLLLFFAISTGMAMVVRRPALDRLVIVASAVPIALLANVARITVTGVLNETAGARVAHVVYHDLAGWLMMPMALAMLWGEIWLLAHLLVEPPPRAHLDLARPSPGAGPPVGGAAGRDQGRAGAAVARPASS